MGLIIGLDRDLGLRCAAKHGLHPIRGHVHFLVQFRAEHAEPGRIIPPARRPSVTGSISRNGLGIKKRYLLTNCAHAWMMLPPQKPGPDPVKLDACTAWLAQQLQAGPRSRAELIILGATAGFSRSTLDRAKAALRLAHAIAPDQRHLWSLPTPSPATPSPRSDRTYK